MITSSSFLIAAILCSLITLSICEEDEATSLAKVFDEMDTNGNKKVTFKEVSTFLSSKGLNQDDQDFKRTVQTFMDSYDKNKDKIITYDEFVPKHDEL
ncbi:16 kDa calcium-binding protein-like [Mytilus trossulus]|uniref:16 kDa calcium-binding protein-like n=1 Tax=Mytilus trossulus TaxID=6551 RepID=UPI0030063AFE